MMSDPLNDAIPGTPPQLGWVRRASAVAMARGNRHPRLFGRTATADVRMDGVAARRRPPLRGPRT